MGNATTVSRCKLTFGRKVAKAARTALRLLLQDQPPQATPSQESDRESDLDLRDLFTIDVAGRCWPLDGWDSYYQLCSPSIKLTSSVNYSKILVALCVPLPSS